MMIATSRQTLGARSDERCVRWKDVYRYRAVWGVDRVQIFDQDESVIKNQRYHQGLPLSLFASEPNVGSMTGV